MIDRGSFWPHKHYRSVCCRIKHMAECVVKLLLERLTSFLIEETALLGRLGYELSEIKMELESIHSFLIDADRRKGNNQVVRTWVNQVRDVAYDIEDIIDEFMHKDQHRKGRYLRSFLHYPMEIISRSRLSSQIQQIKSRVQAISERRNRYGLDRVEEETRSISH